MEMRLINFGCTEKESGIIDRERSPLSKERKDSDEISMQFLTIVIEGVYKINNVDFVSLEVNTSPID